MKAEGWDPVLNRPFTSRANAVLDGAATFAPAVPSG